MECIRYFEMTNFREINKVTLFEYRLRMQAHRLKQIDKEKDMHWQAWLNWNVQATKKAGKNKLTPVFKTFKQFFDYEKILKGTDNKNDKELEKKRNIANILKKQKERREQNGEL